VPTETALQRTREALDSIAKRGPECLKIVNHGRDLLDKGHLKYFDRKSFVFSNPDSIFDGGAPRGNKQEQRPSKWIVLAKHYVDDLYVHDPGFPFGLQWL
jgi:hypothetical protein